MKLLNSTLLVVLFTGLAVLMGVIFILYRKSANTFKQQLETLQESEKHYSVLIKTIPSIVLRGMPMGAPISSTISLKP